MRTCLNFSMFDQSGKKVREKSGNFDILCGWQPWTAERAAMVHEGYIPQFGLNEFLHTRCRLQMLHSRLF